ncbi:MAG: N-6 DNA methylase [Phycisphaerae bacterium]|nr:N-6 DNA methylase [Phycisphaerae bacterium]
MPDEKAVLTALRKFADSVTSKMTTLTVGEPEDQLRGPFEVFMEEVGRALSLKVVCTGETRLPGRMGKPDYAVHAAELLAGYVELKAPDTGADPNRFTEPHNREQWKRFQGIPNLIYCDGNEWGLHQNGEPFRLVHLSGNVRTDGKKSVNANDAQAVLGLITRFLSWDPIIPKNVKDLAGQLAPLCRMLRADVTDALLDTRSPLVQLAKDWRQLLFPDASDEQFADAYAQTVTFALLLARSEGADPLSLASAEGALAADHSLLSRALQVLTDPNAQAEISASLNLLIRVIGHVPDYALAGPRDPWLYFYEDFLAIYDSKLRKDAGAYYTPVEVVRAQVRLIDDLLTNRLGKTLGFAERDVVTLDPAVGTGTYLLGVIEHALRRVHAEQGLGAVAGQATALADNLFGFEIMAGPYAVSELRVSRALVNMGATLPPKGAHVYLTDTLESPHTTPSQMGLWYKEIAEQHRRALEVKDRVPVIVCLGNPPYDRHPAVDATEENLSKYGGWVRFGDALAEGTVKGKAKTPHAVELSLAEVLHRREKLSILYQAFVEPAIAAGHGIHVKNLYNLYVYFWRWAIWKVFEHQTSAGPGVVSYISASSYLDGDAFCGMREHMRRWCDEIWIIDLGGEGRGTRKSQNVFAIQTPVAIAIAARYNKTEKSTPAKVRYTRIDGTRDEKLKALDAIAEFASLQWEDCPDGWHAPFRPTASGKYCTWPLLTDLLPWQHSGAQFKRTWPICPDRNTLEARWRTLLAASDKAVAFRETRDRKVNGSYPPLRPGGRREKPLGQLVRNAPVPDIVRYAYRSLDRQWILADNRLGDFLRPDLWAVQGDKQVYLTSLFSQPLGGGPALTACADIPDLDYFRGSYGAKAVMPLHRDAQGREVNVLPGLADMLAQAYGRKVMPEDFTAYVYGVLAQPAFTDRFADELGARELRVPLTKDALLFVRARDAGAKLLWLHTYGQRYVPKGHPRGQVPKGKARCTKPVPGDASNYPENYEYNEAPKTLRVGDGEFAPVAPEVYEFEVSGLKVVQSWLKYRMKNRMRNGGGKKSSPLDDIRPQKWTGDFTTELLELLWVLEMTVAEYSAQAKLLSAVVKGPCFRADELPCVPDSTRKPPSRQAGKGLFDEAEDKDA